jgi:transcriptional regulator with XRE-family HTH domain
MRGMANEKRPSPKGEKANELGKTIRALRKQLGLTLEEVGQRTGMSVPTLSKLEQGHSSPSFDKLQVLSRGLGVEVSRLLEPAAALADGPARAVGRRAVQRRGSGFVVDTRTYHQEYLGTELLNKRFAPILVELRARTLEEFKTEFQDLIRHPGEEFCLVLEGEVEFHSELYAPVRLGVGDSIYFDSDMGHAYLAAAPGTCRILSVCASAGPGSDVMEHFLARATAAEAPAAPAPAAPAAPTARKRAVRVKT